MLSIGYSACHWCHVMERESFEDPTTADLMNRHFVNIKVDREERPDLDTIYMRAVQSMTGHGGWPLTAFLTPDGSPYYGGTYFPPEPRHGMPSFRQVLDAAARAYSDRKSEVTTAATELLTLIERSMSNAGMVAETGHAELGTDLVTAAYRHIARGYDQTHGGFGAAPKFPQPMVLELLLRVFSGGGHPQALEMAVDTLRKMARGGMHDQLAGGFHRYSVDVLWLVPHFEKMLYDNALLARAYLEAYLLTEDDELREVTEKTLDYVLDDLRSPEGGFYSARDADSEGEEGLFYVWTAQQIEDLLEPATARLFCRAYDVSPGGNFEGRNILHLPHELEAIAGAEGMALSELRATLGGAARTLLEARSEREPPFRDEKIITGWNGLAIRALAEAGGALGRPDYVDAAERAAEFISTVLWHEGRLLRGYKGRPSPVQGFLEDYGAFGGALLSLHEVTLEPKWLVHAVDLADALVAGFWIEDEGIFFDTRADAAPLVVRPREVTDNATPSGNSLAVELLLRLGRLLDRDDWRGIVGRVLSGEAGSMARFPSAFGRLLSVADSYLEPGLEVAIVGSPEDPATRALLDVVHGRYLPHRVVTGGVPADLPFPTPLLEGRTQLDGLPTAYVCRGYRCREPVTEPAALAAQLGSAESSNRQQEAEDR